MENIENTNVEKFNTNIARCDNLLLDSNEQEIQTVDEQNSESSIDNIVTEDLEVITPFSPSLINDSGMRFETEQLDNKRISTISTKNSSTAYLKKILKYRGYFLGVFAAFLLSFSKVILKKSPLLAGSDHSLIRYIIQFVFLFLVIKYKMLSLLGPSDPKVRKMLRFRGLIGALGMICLHFAITLIAPSDTVAITHSSVIITAILARIFLKERFSIAHIFSLVLTVLGILLISQPSFLFKSTEAERQQPSNNSFIWNNSSQNSHLTQSKGGKSIIHFQSSYVLYMGILFTLCGALTTGIVQTTIKHLCNKKVHYSIIIIHSSYFGIPISILISLILYLTGVSYKNGGIKLGIQCIITQVSWSILSSIVGLLAQICLSLSLKYEEASKRAIIKTTDLIFTFIFQSYLVNIEKDYLSSIGAYLILSGAFLVFVFKFIEKKFNHKDVPANIRQSKTVNNQNINNNSTPLFTNKLNNTDDESGDFSFWKFFKMFIFFKF